MCIVLEEWKYILKLKETEVRIDIFYFARMLRVIFDIKFADSACVYIMLLSQHLDIDSGQYTLFMAPTNSVFFPFCEVLFIMIGKIKNF